MCACVHACVCVCMHVCVCVCTCVRVCQLSNTMKRGLGYENAWSLDPCCVQRIQSWSVVALTAVYTLSRL